MSRSERNTMSRSYCPFCEHGNPADAKYCSECGGALHLAPCPRCGAVNLTTAAACYQCRGTLAGPRADALGVSGVDARDMDTIAHDGPAAEELDADSVAATTQGADALASEALETDATDLDALARDAFPADASNTQDSGAATNIGDALAPTALKIDALDFDAVARDAIGADTSDTDAAAPAPGTADDALTPGVLKIDTLDLDTLARKALDAEQGASDMPGNGASDTDAVAPESVATDATDPFSLAALASRPKAGRNLDDFVPVSLSHDELGSSPRRGSTLRDPTSQAADVFRPSSRRNVDFFPGRTPGAGAFSRQPRHSDARDEKPLADEVFRPSVRESVDGIVTGWSTREKVNSMERVTLEPYGPIRRGTEVFLPASVPPRRAVVPVQPASEVHEHKPRRVFRTMALYFMLTVIGVVSAFAYYQWPRLGSSLEAASKNISDSVAPAGVGIIRRDSGPDLSHATKADMSAATVSPPSASATGVNNQAVVATGQRATRQPTEPAANKPNAPVAARPPASTVVGAGALESIRPAVCTEAVAAFGWCTLKPTEKTAGSKSAALDVAAKRAPAKQTRAPGGQEASPTRACAEGVSALALCAPDTARTTR